MHPILSFPNHHFPICFPSNILCPCLISLFQYLYIQGGLNMTGTDLCVKSRTAQQVCDLERVKPQPPPSLLLGLEPVQSCLGVARVMSNYGYKKKKSVPVIFEPPCIFIYPYIHPFRHKPLNLIVRMYLRNILNFPRIFQSIT